MAKTKRTAEEAEVVAAAASNNSKLVTQGGLNHFATKFWDKIKTRYDGTFKAVRLTNDKKLIFTKTNSNEDEINLKDYARLTDKNNFKHDVSADDVVVLNNRDIGTSFEYTSNQRSLGFRQFTTNSFSEGYVDYIKIYMPDSISSGTKSTWFAWAIKKGETDRNGDRVVEVIHSSKQLSVESIRENSAEKKFVKIPINKSFENDIYFVVKCTTHDVEVVKNIKSEYVGDVVNLSPNQPPTAPGGSIDWNVNATNNTAVMQLFGRESIGSLHNKINKLSPDSGLYVKHSETTNTGGTNNANMVVKLDGDGKLDKNMLPSIAINEYFTVEQFTNEALRDKVYENGDVAVVTSTSKKYLCINRNANTTTNTINDFIELNSKDGSVVSVNRKTGAVNLELEATTDKLKLKITGDGGTTDVTETSVNIITNDEIDTIINGLRD